MRQSFITWPLYVLLAFSPAPAYPDVATQMQAIFDRHEMSIERAPEIEAMMDEMEERWMAVSEQVEAAMTQLNDFSNSAAGQRMAMQDDIPYTLETFVAVVEAFRAQDAYFQWQLTQLEHYFERHNATECLAKLAQVRNNWESSCKTDLMQYANSDVSTPEGRLEAISWELAYNASVLNFIGPGGHTAIVANFASSSLNCTAF